VLSVMLGATVYTFSIILAVYLIGLGIGSGVGSVLARRIARAHVAFGVCQMLLAGSIAWTAWMLSKSLPYWPIDPSLAVNPWFNFQLDFVRTACTIFPATLLWGASFPLALAALVEPGQDPGGVAGDVYGSNTAGAIIGAMLFSLIIVPSIGTMHAERLLIGLSSVAAVVVIGWPGVEQLAIGLTITVALIWSVGEIPWQVTAYGRSVAPMIRTD